MSATPATSVTRAAPTGARMHSAATRSTAATGAAAPSPREPSTLTVVPPPLPRRGERRDVLAPAARRSMIVLILSLHLLAIWAVFQIREVREAVAFAAPMFVSLLATPDVPKAIETPPPPVAPKPSTPPPAVVAVTPSAMPSNFEVAVPAQVIAEPSPPAPSPVVVATAPAAALVPPAAPKTIPASAIQYLEPIELEYPRLSKRNGESGLTTIRVYIDENGRARNAQVHRSSGHTRLDEAALAAVQRARFKPYTENGVPVAGYAYIPLEFELEK